MATTEQKKVSITVIRLSFQQLTRLYEDLQHVQTTDSIAGHIVMLEHVRADLAGVVDELRERARRL